MWNVLSSLLLVVETDPEPIEIALVVKLALGDYIQGGHLVTRQLLKCEAALAFARVSLPQVKSLF